MTKPVADSYDCPLPIVAFANFTAPSLPKQSQRNFAGLSIFMLGFRANFMRFFVILVGLHSTTQLYEKRRKNNKLKFV